MLKYPELTDRVNHELGKFPIIGKTQTEHHCIICEQGYGKVI